MSDASCGRRTCDDDAAVTYTTKRGAMRTRCDVHALADGVDGIGECGAHTILNEFDLETLVDRVEGADGKHAIPRLSRLDGLGPTSAAKIGVAIDESPVAKAVRERGGRDAAVAPDGGDDSAVPMTESGGVLVPVFDAGPDPAAFQQWKQSQEAGRDE